MAASFVLGSANTFAMDQITLKSGAKIRGKILSDRPHQHVDFQDERGNKTRYAADEVANKEWDIPSTASEERKLQIKDSQFYLGAGLGGQLVLNNQTNKKLLFSYGAKMGATFGKLGDFSQATIGLSFQRSARTDTILGTEVSSAWNELMAQFLFTQINNTGFYIGPEIGIGIRSAVNNTQTTFAYGVNMGYDFYASESFSIGPDLHLIQMSAGQSGSPFPDSQLSFRFLLSGSIHF